MRDRTTEYARAAAGGRRIDGSPAGELEILAARRHLRDLDEGAARGLVWRPEQAEWMIDFYPAMFSITDGPHADRQFELLPWMLFCTGSLFGWYKGENLRFNWGYIETTKGQGKSPWLGATGLLLTGGRGRKRAQVIAIGPREEQARLPLAEAAALCRVTMPGAEEGETLEAAGKFVIRGLGDNAHKIEHPASQSVMKTSSSSRKQSGPKPVAVLLEEVHELDSLDLVDSYKNAVAKVADGLFLAVTNTPAQSQAVGTHLAENAIKALSGGEDHDADFTFVTRIDATERETCLENEACWGKASPAMGVTFPAENLRREAAKARATPSEAARVKRLYLGVPVGAVDFWLPEHLWSAVLAPVDEAGLVNCRCWLSVDLSKKNDLTAVSAAWERPDGTIAVKTWYWTARLGMVDRAKAAGLPLEKWEADGALRVCEGSTVEFEAVALFVREMVEAHQVQLLAFDPAMMGDFEKACANVNLPVWRFKGDDQPAGKGLKLVSHMQGKSVDFKGDRLSMPRSIDALEDRILKRTIAIDANPLTTACAANAVPEADGMNNRMFHKAKSRGVIDGLVTTAMAVGAMKMGETKPKGRGRLHAL